MSREHAIDIFKAAVAAVQPAVLMHKTVHLTNDKLRIGSHEFLRCEIKNLYVIGAGKAAAAMALSIETILGDFITEGYVVTKYGHALPTQKIRISEAAHPVPDDNSVAAVGQTLQLLQKVTKEDVVICLLSGGASALWCDLPAEITLADMQQTSQLLLQCGANIKEINTVRKHISTIKGGKLVHFCNGASVVSLIISDVPGNDLHSIASGPTTPDASTFQDAYSVFQKYNLEHAVPRSVVKYIRGGMVNENSAIVDNTGLFDKVCNYIIGDNKLAVSTALNTAKALGYQTFLLPHLLTGFAEEEAKQLLDFAIKEKF